MCGLVGIESTTCPTSSVGTEMASAKRPSDKEACRTMGTLQTRQTSSFLLSVQFKDDGGNMFKVWDV